MLQRRFTFHLPSGKNAAFNLAASKPDIGPQSNPKGRGGRIKYADCSELLRKAFSSVRGLFPTKYERMSACGKSLGRCSWNSVSQAMITVTGAAMVLSTLPGASAGLRTALAAGVVRKTNLAREPLALLAPRLANS